MSIEKLSDASRVYIEKSPYTQIFNLIIEHIKDNDALRLYSYLASKSRDWTVVKTWTAKKCDVGERKAKQCWAYLERCNLIEYHVMRDGLGKIIKHDLRVLNGSKFDQNEPFLKLSTSTIGAETAPEAIHRCNNPPCGETTRVGFAPLLNKDLTNKDLEKKERRSFRSSNDKKHAWAKQKPNLASVDNQSNSYNEQRMYERAPVSSILAEFMKKQGIKE